MDALHTHTSPPPSPPPSPHLSLRRAGGAIGRALAPLGAALCAALCALVAAPESALAADGGASANNAWIITATALVLFMTLPGLALFYGGLARSRSLLSVLLHCFVITCVVSLLWLAGGYSLVFADGGALQPWIGSLDRAWLSGVDAQSDYGGGLAVTTFFIFQMTFAVITPALVVGAWVERISFGAVLFFTLLFSLVVYVPVAHWVWGGGWLAQLGVMDFAGGIVVHVTAGVAALTLALLMRPRDGFPGRPPPPHAPGMAMAGAAMLWVGWYGFNGGSALTADGAAAMAIAATHMAASAAALTWMVVEWRQFGKPTSGRRDYRGDRRSGGGHPGVWIHHAAVWGSDRNRRRLRLPESGQTYQADP